MKKKDYIVIPERELGVHEECGVMGIKSPCKKELAREKRREKRRLLKGSTDTEEVETSEGEE